MEAGEGSIRRHHPQVLGMLWNKNLDREILCGRSLSGVLKFINFSECYQSVRHNSLWYLKVDRDRKILRVGLRECVCGLNHESGWSYDNWCA